MLRAPALETLIGEMVGRIHWRDGGTDTLERWWDGYTGEMVGRIHWRDGGRDTLVR